MNYKKWKAINDDGYSSDAISILQFIKEQEELDEEHLKTQSILSLLERKQLINENKLTLLGEELLNSLELEELVSVKAPKKIEFFDEWWGIYPASDSFTYNGQTFAGTQSKRVKKDLCKAHFKKAVNNGISEQDIIAATTYHIEQAKKLSIKKGNQLSFIANSERYLRESMYEPYIEISKNQVKEETFKSNII